MLLIFIMLSTFTGCGKNTVTGAINVSVGKYIMLESEEPLKPSVVLDENNMFMFTYSMLSSYVPTGSYEVADGKLILNTNDGKYKYVFKIKSNELIFDAKESSEIPSYANVPDGAVFRREIDEI